MEPTSDPVAVAAEPAFKDRRTGLIIFGVVEIVIGAVCVLFIPLMFAGQMMSARMTGEAPQLRMIIPGAVTYAVVAAAFMAIGIGSILARRWARALCLIVAWSWLLMGAMLMVIYAILLRQVLGGGGAGIPPMGRETAAILTIVALAFIAIIFVIVPGALVFFYQSKHVKATCEARDPIPRWTDSRPLPVIALSLWLVFGALFMLLMPAYGSVAPFFGRLISGLPGTVFYLGLTALWLYCAWAIYRLKPAGWWAIVIALAMACVSNLMTFSKVDLMEFYRLMGYPERQIEQMQQFTFLQGNSMALWTTIGLAPFFVLLIYVKRFFRQPPDESRRSVSA